MYILHLATLQSQCQCKNDKTPNPNCEGSFWRQINIQVSGDLVSKYCGTVTREGEPWKFCEENTMGFTEAKGLAPL